MKFIIQFLLISVVVFACNKSSTLGSDFTYFVGTWKNMNGDVPVTIEIHNNGRIIVHKSIERGIDFKARFFWKDSIEQSDYEQYLLSKDEQIENKNYLIFKKHPNEDTLFFLTGTLIENSVAMYGEEIKFIRD